MLQVTDKVYETCRLEPLPSLRFPGIHETWILCTCIMPDIAICKDQLANEPEHLRRLQLDGHASDSQRGAGLLAIVQVCRHHLVVKASCHGKSNFALLRKAITKQFKIRFSVSQEYTPSKTRTWNKEGSCLKPGYYRRNQV